MRLNFVIAPYDAMLEAIVDHENIRYSYTIYGIGKDNSAVFNSYDLNTKITIKYSDNPLFVGSLRECIEACDNHFEKEIAK